MIEQLRTEGYVVVDGLALPPQTREHGRLVPEASDSPGACLFSLLDPLATELRLHDHTADRRPPKKRSPFNEGWHVDAFVKQGGTPRKTPLKSGDPVIFTVIRPWDTFTDDNGATELEPGSHLRPMALWRESLIDWPSERVRCLLDSTEALVFIGSHVAHRAGIPTSTSTEERSAELYRFSGVWR